MSLITDLCRDYKNSIPPNAIQHIANKGCEITKIKMRASLIVNAIAQCGGFSEKKNIRIDFCKNPFEIIPSVLVRGKESGTIFLPVLIFLARSQIPFTGPHDETLQDERKVTSFFDSVADAFKLSKRKIQLVDYHHLSLFLRFFQHPDLAKNGLKFAILHELGHLFHGHQRPVSILFKSVNFLSLGILGCINHLFKEREADFFSYRHSVEVAEGGIYLFQTLINHSEGTFSIKMFNIFIRCTLVFTHGACASRIKAIKNYWSTKKMKKIE